MNHPFVAVCAQEEVPHLAILKPHALPDSLDFPSVYIGSFYFLTVENNSFYLEQHGIGNVLL